MKQSLAHRVKKPSPQKPSPPKKHGNSGKLRSVRIEPAANGGHTVTHDYDAGDDNGLIGYSQKPHVFADTPSMMKHVGGLFGHKGEI